MQKKEFNCFIDSVPAMSSQKFVSRLLEINTDPRYSNDDLDFDVAHNFVRQLDNVYEVSMEYAKRHINGIESGVITIVEDCYGRHKAYVNPSKVKELVELGNDEITGDLRWVAWLIRDKSTSFVDTEEEFEEMPSFDIEEFSNQCNHGDVKVLRRMKSKFGGDTY